MLWTLTKTSFFVLSSLFPDVVNCMQTDNLELKKLVYLYLMNYAKSQPDMAIMAVNSFVKARPKMTFSTVYNTASVSDTETVSVYTKAKDKSLICGLSRPPGLWGPQPSDPGPGCPHHGLHPGGQDHRVPVWATEEVSEGWGPVCEEDGGCLCGQTSWHQCPDGGGSGLPGLPQRSHCWLKSHGEYLSL